MALGIVLLLGYPLSTALTVSASLAQIGEFSFILAGLGITYQLMAKEGLNLILAGALLSITLNPLIFAGADRLIRRVRGNPELKKRFEDARSAGFESLKQNLETTHLRAEKRAAAHKTFTPEELVDRFPLFKGLTPEQHDRYTSSPAALSQGNASFGPVTRPILSIFISEGQVEVSVGGRRIKLGPGDFFGEMALISGLPRSADVTALDYSKFATLSRRDFRQFLSRYPHIRDQIATLAGQRREMNGNLAKESA